MLSILFCSSSQPLPCSLPSPFQALEHDRMEKFNVDLFRKLGELGLLGMTVDEEYGGSGMDSTAAVIVHEELSAADPAFCLAFLAHSMLFANNLNLNGNHEQKMKYLPGACDGTLIGGMGMSEPGAGTDVLGLTSKAMPKLHTDPYTDPYLTLPHL